MMMGTNPLRDAYRILLDAAATVADTGDTSAAPPAGEWNADQILAHIASVDAGIIAAAYAVASGANTTYDNRTSLDTWTIERVIALAGDNVGLRDRIRLQGDALCTLSEQVLSETELDTLVPTLLLSADNLQVDQPVPLRALISGLAEDHLPRHAEQLLALLPEDAVVAATT